MDNIRFKYLYRDGANFQSRGEVLFSNLEGIPLQIIEERLLKAFLPDKLFIASQIDIPEVFLFKSSKITAYDHCFHEFDSVELCQESLTDTYARSIDMFLADVENIGTQGWIAFDITLRL